MGDDRKKWAGPPVLESIRGTIDDMSMQDSEYKDAAGNPKQRVHITLVDVVQTFTDREAESESRQLWIAADGRPGQVLAASLKGLLGLGKKDVLDFDELTGCEMVLDHHTEPFTVDGERKDMHIYTAVSLNKGAVADANDDVVVAAIEGKTPHEVVKMRTAYKGTPYMQILGNKTSTLKHFADTVELVGGKYVRKA